MNILIVESPKLKKKFLFIPFALLRQRQGHGGELIFFIEDVVLIGMGVIQCRLWGTGLWRRIFSSFLR